MYLSKKTISSSTVQLGLAHVATILYSESSYSSYVLHTM